MFIEVTRKTGENIYINAHKIDTVQPIQNQLPAITEIAIGNSFILVLQSVDLIKSHIATVVASHRPHIYYYHTDVGAEEHS